MVIGIIGGSGVYRADALRDLEKIKVETEYGGCTVTHGYLENREMFFIARHGENHSTPPHMVNYRAHIRALEKLGVERLIATCAVGSLRDDIPPGTFVLPDQYIDFTKNRRYTFYDNGVVHISMADPFCPEMTEITANIINSHNFPLRKGGTYMCIEGPRFSTRAESRMFKNFGDIVGMTLVPECQLAREAGMCYTCISMVTDYDVYGEKPVSATDVKKVMQNNGERVQKVIEGISGEISERRACSCKEALEEAK